MQLFLSLEHLEVIIELLTGHNFNIIVSQGIGKPKGRERDGEQQAVEQSEHPQHLLIKFY